MSLDRPRVLLIAEACNPEWESVPLVGYNWYRAIRERADVVLVTQIRNRAALLRHVADPEQIVFINSEPLASPFHRLGSLLTLGRGLGWTTRQAAMWIPYLYFEHLVFERFGAALKRGEYDIVHRLTPLSPTYPSPIASWVDAPFVIGPLNGGLPWPKGTTRTRFAEMEVLSYLRDVYRLLPYVRTTYERAACVLAGSRYTLSALPRSARSRAVYMPENGIDPARFYAEGRIPPSQIRPFRILFVGRLVPYKGADLVLEAFASSPTLRQHAEYVIVGDGPQRFYLETRAKSLGVADRVRFMGRVPQTQVAEFFRTSSVFAFPSLREFGGAVVIEAMACGLPCIVLNYGGPGELMTPHIGIALSVAKRHQLTAAIRCGLEHLESTPDELDTMSKACVRHVLDHHTWSRRTDQLGRVYDDLLHTAPGRLTRPK